jgi:extracellular factor (EF) 3-hydroxypalmitic acid methyl ester biosynthesis protein
MLRTRDLRGRLGVFDFIYSMGLFDYLTAPVARAVLARTVDLLAPGGEIVVGNFHVTTPTRTYMDYWADWTLIYRSEESLLALAEGLPIASARIDFDETRCQMFLRLQRSV